MLLVIGAIMGVLLVGALWYIASIGDAILFRERMQDAADATAFESAVWHARGMNAVALLNIVMAAILSVLVALRVFEFLCTTYLVLTGIICVASFFIPFFSAACQPLLTFGRVVGRALEKTLNLDRRVAPKIMNALLIINKTERVIASVSPILALVESSASNTAFYGLAGAPDFTMAISPVLMPVEADEILQNGFKWSAPAAPGEDRGAGGTQFPARMGTLKPGKPGAVLDESNGVNPFPSLPLAEDGYWMVCMRAGAFLPSQLGQLADRVGAVGLGQGLNLFADVLGEIAGSIPSLACMPWEKSPVEQRLDAAVNAKCDEQKKKYEEEHKTGDGKVDPPWTDKMMYHCKKKNKGELGNNVASADNAKPAKVWDIVVNGSVFLHVWSFARAGEPPLQKRDDQGLAVADSGRQSQRPATGRGGGWMNMDWVNFSVAEAEYYFDCKGSWSGGYHAPWDGGSYSPGKTCKDNATWQLGWTARMRRVWWPQDELNLEDIIVGWSVNAFYKYAGYYIGYGAEKAKLNPHLTKSLWDTWLTNQFIKKNVSAGVRQALPNSLQSPGYWLMQKANDGKRRTIIH